MNRIASLAALVLLLAFTFHGCGGCGGCGGDKDKDQDEQDEDVKTEGEDVKTEGEDVKVEGKGEDVKVEGKGEDVKTEGEVFQATLYTNEYEGSEGLIKMIAVIGNTNKKRCKINIITVPMKLATVYSPGPPSTTLIPTIKIDKKPIDVSKVRTDWRKTRGCSDHLNDTHGSCKIEASDLKKEGLQYAPWYVENGGSLPMLKIEKNVDEIRMFGVNSIETTLARKCLGSPGPDDDESYTDTELRETYHSIIDPLMKIALYERGNDNSLIHQLRVDLQRRTIEKLKRLDGIIEKLKLYEEKNVKFTSGALAVLQLFGSTCPDVDEYFNTFKDMDAVAESGEYTDAKQRLKHAPLHMQQFGDPTKVRGGATNMESEMEKRRELNYLVKYFRSIQRKILLEKDGTQTEKSVRKALENYLDSPLTLLHETTWENVYIHHPYLTVSDKRVITEKLEKEYSPKHARFIACRAGKSVLAPAPGAGAPPALAQFVTMDWIGNVEQEANIDDLFHDPRGSVTLADYPVKGHEKGFKKGDEQTVFSTFCSPSRDIPRKFDRQCEKLEEIAKKEEEEHPFRGYARAALRIELGNYQGRYQGYDGGYAFQWDPIKLRRQPSGNDAEDTDWGGFGSKIGVQDWDNRGLAPLDNFATMREYWFFNKWKMTMRLRDWLQIIHTAPASPAHWFKDITDRHKILVLLYMSKQVILEEGNLERASIHAKERYVAVKRYEESLEGKGPVDYMILRALYVKWKPSKYEEGSEDGAKDFLTTSFELIYGYPEPAEEEPKETSDHFLEQDDDKFFNSLMPLHLAMDS